MITTLRICALLAALQLVIPALRAQQATPVSKDSTQSNDDLLNLLDGEAKKGTERSYTTATFKSTRIINGHSIEQVGKGVLDFRIAHRFGEINQGARNFFGLDDATTKLAFDYGVTDWLMIGIGRSTYQKDYDGYAKIKLYRQTDDNRHPVSVSYLGGISILDNTAPETNGAKYYFSNRVSYVNQLLVARKVNRWLSLQLTPTHIHYNLVATSDEPNDVLAMGVGGRLKVSNRIAITGEWYYTIPGHKLNDIHNALSAGVDIETGGHVFQLFFTNSQGITEHSFIAETTGRPFNGDLHFGFNISRVFTIVKPKEFRGGKGKAW